HITTMTGCRQQKPKNGLTKCPDLVDHYNKQAEYYGHACQKAPSVVVTKGWGSHDLLADLGNNDSTHLKSPLLVTNQSVY
uniref:hypothetical protein n=1 Tax=Aeromonas veronii TaxID=654 RepID=UPI003B9ED3FB